MLACVIKDKIVKEFTWSQRLRVLDRLKILIWKNAENNKLWFQLTIPYHNMARKKCLINIYVNSINFHIKIFNVSPILFLILAILVPDLNRIPVPMLHGQNCMLNIQHCLTQHCCPPLLSCFLYMSNRCVFSFFCIKLPCIKLLTTF